MSYQVIARKWRPQSFEELVGQKHVTQTLLNALRSGRLPHALLFSGARGVGKTSSARIFAKSLRCPNVIDFVPCNKCQTCHEVASGSHLDVIEIDGASNNGVDSIRELRESVGFMPSSGKYKVYIIDEVHMLSTSAFNALLKTLEEPPAHVVFIFATTEPQKIPVTILSRCQRFDFKRIPTRQIAERLKLICQTENLNAEEEALWTIARQADGAMRDSQSLLDQAVTFCNGNITQDQVTQILGLTDRTLLLQTLAALVDRDAKSALTIIEKLYSAGFDPSQYLQDLIEECRHLLLIKTAPQETTTIVDLPDSEIESLKNLSAKLSDEDVHMIFDMALKGAQDMARAHQPRIVLEMLLMRMVAAPRILDIQSVFSRGQGGPSSPSNANKSTAATNTTTVEKPTVRTQEPNVLANPAITNTSAPATTSTLAEVKFNPQLSLQDNWVQFVQNLKNTHPVLGAKLEFTALTSLDSNIALLSLPKNQEFLLSQLKEPNATRQLNQTLSQFWGHKIEVQLTLIDGRASPQSQPMSPKEIENQKLADKQAQILSEIQKNPIVQKANDVFKMKLTSIKETKE